MTQRRTTSRIYPVPTRRIGSHSAHYPLKKQSIPTWMTVGAGMLLALIAIPLMISVASWIGTVHDDMAYGTPRTYQTDYNVGHNGVSHFVAMNIHQKAIVIEMVGGDPEHSVTYIAPGSIPDTTAPVIVTFKDVNQDNLPDMIMHAGSQTFVFLNTGKAFRLATSRDKIELE